jgi:hypothetical protein
LELEEHVFSEYGLEEPPSLREQAVREDIARRLEKICSNFSHADFEVLVAMMAARQVKWEPCETW